MGHETRRRRGGSNKQWGKHSIPPAILAFLQKRGGGSGKKYFIFAIFFAEPIFAKKTCLRFIFFADNNNLCRELKHFCKSLGFGRYSNLQQPYHMQHVCKQGYL